MEQPPKLLYELGNFLYSFLSLTLGLLDNSTSMLFFHNHKAGLVCRLLCIFVCVISVIGLIIESNILSMQLQQLGEECADPHAHTP